MIIYNVTYKVENNIVADWLRWMQEEHIEELVGTGCFTNGRILKLIDIDDSDGPTFAVQFEANSKGDYDRYLSEHAAFVRGKANKKWGDRAVSFRSVLELVGGSGGSKVKSER